MTTLTLRDVTIEYSSGGYVVRPINGLDLDVADGELARLVELAAPQLREELLSAVELAEKADERPARIKVESRLGLDHAEALRTTDTTTARDHDGGEGESDRRGERHAGKGEAKACAAEEA